MHDHSGLEVTERSLRPEERRRVLTLLASVLPVVAGILCFCVPWLISGSGRGREVFAMIGAGASVLLLSVVARLLWSNWLDNRYGKVVDVVIRADAVYTVDGLEHALLMFSGSGAVFLRGAQVGLASGRGVESREPGVPLEWHVVCMSRRGGILSVEAKGARKEPGRSVGVWPRKPIQCRECAVFLDAQADDPERTWNERWRQLIVGR